jgi:hypothetical protein
MLTSQGIAAPHSSRLSAAAAAETKASYRGCVKWKEAKAALVKRAPIERSKVSGAPSPLTAPKVKRAEPSAEQENLAGTTLSVVAVSSRL